MLVTVGSGLLRLFEELFCSLREGAGQGVVTNLAHDEVAVAGGRSLAVQSERILTVVSLAGIEAEVVPVAGGYCLLLFRLGDTHAALDTMVDARSVSDNDRRTIVAFRLGKGLNALIVVSAHSHLGNVYIAIAHSDAGQILFLGSLTGSSELSDGTNRSSLGGLSAGVGVNLGVEHQNVHVLRKR